MSDIQKAYQEVVETMRDLGSALIPATAVQFEAPPKFHASQGTGNARGVKNPTLDIVLDPRRDAVSEEIKATTAALRQARALLDPHRDLLRQAVARWEGDTEETTA